MAISSICILPAFGQVSSENIQPIKIDGSSTVYPITQAVLEAYQAKPTKQEFKDIKIEDDFSGTGGGFQKFCAGEADIIFDRLKS